MPKLLKILTGPQEGAEIELTPDAALHIGSDASCDVMLVDTMAPQDALVIALEGTEVFATAHSDAIFVVDRKLVEGEKTPLQDYAVITIGSTRCAIGDSDQTWPAMRWIPLDVLLAEKLPDPSALQSAPPSAHPDSSALQSASPSAHPDSSALQAEENTEEKSSPPLSREQLEKLSQLQSDKRASRTRAQALLLWGALILICLIGMYLAGHYVWNLTKPKTNLATLLENARQTRNDKLMEKIRQHGLTLLKDEHDMPIRLVGNLATTSQRVHIEQFIKYDYPYITAELTDDETLTKSLSELLHGLTDDRITIDSLHDCQATVSGMTATETEWHTIHANIINDIPRLRDIKGDIVYADVMAAKLREALKKTNFNNVRVEILPGELQFTGFVSEERHQDFELLLAEAAKFFPKQAKLTNLVKWKTEDKIADDSPAVPAAVKKENPKVLPITGIVVSPFPCVILEDGQRLGVGSQIGDYVIDAINLTEVSLSHNDEKIIWHP